MNLGMELSKVLFAAEPGLLNNDIAASARAAREVSNLLGCIMATVLIKQPENYQSALAALFHSIHESATDTVQRAGNVVPERVQ